MKIETKFIWDYDTTKLDLADEQVLLWYLARQINTGQWQKIDREKLQKNYQKLQIDPTLKKMLKKYYALKRTK